MVVGTMAMHRLCPVLGRRLTVWAQRGSQSHPASIVSTGRALPAAEAVEQARLQAAGGLVGLGLPRNADDHPLRSTRR